MEAKLYGTLGIRPCFFFFLCLSIIFTFFTPAISGARAPNAYNQNATGPNDKLIVHVCKLAPYYKLCVDVLKAGAPHKIVDEAGLLRIAIGSTVRMAMQTSLYVGRLSRNTNNEPRYQTAYTACRIRYADVVGKLADWLHHVGKSSNALARRWVESAIDDIITCDKLFNQRGMVNTLSAGNIQLLQMCRNDVEILEHLNSHH
ncbi:hypothetical protein EJ110_NYTH22849 [Nymphaea thermarum]|nr:hypothetical protein EJ110_NYTH22849 [Nymphaea thermarum]